jgi:hypothetical protein
MGRRKGELKNDEWHLVFCFAEKDHAEKFKARFAGEWFDPATRGQGIPLASSERAEAEILLRGGALE